LPALLLLAVLTVGSAQQAQQPGDREGRRPPHIAIVGGGIGGASVAYYAKGLIPDAKISVFERNDYIGGRLHHVDFEGETIELGGSAWTGANQHMQELVKALGINVTSTAPPAGLRAPIEGAFDVWQGDSFVNITAELERSIPDLAVLGTVEQEFLKRIAKNYATLPESGFPDVASFLRFGDLTPYLNSSVRSFFGARLMRPEFVRVALEPLNRNIYNQGADAQSFSLLASLTAQLGHHRVHGGNSLLVEAMLRNASADIFLRSNVSAVTKDAAAADGAGGWLVDYTAAGAGAGAAQAEQQVRADFVVMAAPLERAGVRFLNADLPPGAAIDRQFFDWFVTCVAADGLNPHQFGPASAGYPFASNLLTTSNASAPGVEGGGPGSGLFNESWVSILRLQDTPTGLQKFVVVSAAAGRHTPPVAIFPGSRPPPPLPPPPAVPVL
jgi:hypothetical protein